MKRCLKSLLITFFAIFVTTGCTKTGSIGCEIEKTLVTGAATGVSAALKCSGYEALKADLQAAISKTGLCKEAKSASATEGALDPLCPMIVNSVVSIGMSKVPTAWGCQGGATVDMLKTALLDACAKIL